MSGFMWHGGRSQQLRMRPSLWGRVLWPDVVAAARRAPALPADLLRCVRWLGDKLVNESFMDPEDNRW